MKHTQLIHFDRKTLSNISWLIMQRVKYIQNRSHLFLVDGGNAELERLLLFNTQVLAAFMQVKEIETVESN